MTTVVYPVPPPTSNFLNAKQRNHLVRSTKKLGEILGATPLLSESTQPIAVSLYPNSEASSASSSRSSTPDSTKASRRQASICSYAPDESMFVYQSPDGMSSAVSLALTPSRESPLSKKPSMKFKSPAKPRGSHELPRPLVLRLNAVPSPIKVIQPQVVLSSATSDTLTLPGTPTPTGTPAITPTTPVFPTPAEVRRKRMAKLTRTLGERIPPHLVPMSKKPAASYEEESLETASALPQPVQPLTATRRRRSVSVDFARAKIPSFSRSSRVWVTGSESWRGEWNRKDIKEVQRQLRSLKSR